MGGELASIIRRSLERDPANRFQTAEELEEVLTDLVERVGIEQPLAFLADYLADPEGVAVEWREQLVPRLVTLGRTAADEGDLPTAFDHFNRVLALDEGHEEVLGLIARLGRPSRVRRRAVALGVAVALLGGLGAIGYALGRGPGPGTREPVADAGAGPMSESDEGPGGASGRALVDAAIAFADAGRPDARAGADARAVRAAEATSKVAPVRRAPRPVLLNPYPRDVRIGIDGAPPQPFGPGGIREVALTPGPHDFVFDTDLACCEDVRVTLRVPPGSEPFTLSHSLPFRDATVVVEAGGVAATVRVAAGAGDAATGPAGRALLVPMGRERESREITVTAPGYQDYNNRVLLRAGEPSTVRVELSPAP